MDAVKPGDIGLAIQAITGIGADGRRQQADIVTLSLGPSRIGWNFT
jgi:hypothetical protein